MGHILVVQYLERTGVPLQHVVHMDKLFFVCVVYACMCVYVSVSVYVHVYVRMCVCLYVCTSLSACVSMSVFLHDVN
jgi:hypothetical protein